MILTAALIALPMLLFKAFYSGKPGHLAVTEWGFTFKRSKKEWAVGTTEDKSRVFKRKTSYKDEVAIGEVFLLKVTTPADSFQRVHLLFIAKDLSLPVGLYDVGNGLNLVRHYGKGLVFDTQGVSLNKWLKESFLEQADFSAMQLEHAITRSLLRKRLGRATTSWSKASVA